jgi:hypothetical protein
MHEGNPYGHLKVGNKVIHFSNLARMVGESEELVEQWLNELFEAGVYDLADDGSICSRRMIKDENLRNIRAAGGKLGGNPLLKDKHKDNHEVKQKPTPSSSSSSSSSNIKTSTPEGVSDSIFKDYMEVRKAKKAKWTETALKGLIRESDKANITLEEAMQMCCERGWIGFKAEWLQQAVQKAKELPLGTNEQIEQAYRTECGKDPALARFNNYYEMKSFIIEHREKRVRA